MFHIPRWYETSVAEPILSVSRKERLGRPQAFGGRVALSCCRLFGQETLKTSFRKNSDSRLHCKESECRWKRQTDELDTELCSKSEILIWLEKLDPCYIATSWNIIYPLFLKLPNHHGIQKTTIFKL